MFIRMRAFLYRLYYQCGLLLDRRSSIRSIEQGMMQDVLVYYNVSKSNQNSIVMEEGICARVVEYLPSIHKTPSFTPQDHINLMWWCMPAIQHLESGDKRFRSSRPF